MRGKIAAVGFDRLDRLGDAVAAAQRLQVGVVQRLHADREPVDAGGAIAAEAAGLDAGRIGLERDFGVLSDRPAPVENGDTYSNSVFVIEAQNGW